MFCDYMFCVFDDAEQFMAQDWSDFKVHIPVYGLGNLDKPAKEPRKHEVILAVACCCDVFAVIATVEQCDEVIASFQRVFDTTLMLYGSASREGCKNLSPDVVRRRLGLQVVK